jgi:uncharacterized radical SAM superfamily Fe-S cluster-containing enzyme
MPATKVDRDEVFVEYTKSICPVCKVVVDGQVNIRDGKVYLRKRCKEHGVFEAIVYGDAQMYMDSTRFNKPGTIPLQFQTEVKDGCPSDCGLCPEHKQHACLGIIEVNTNCNLDCPICFADSGHQPDGYSITLEQCERMLDVYVAAEGEAEVVMFSGGEPTIHKDILAMIDMAQGKAIRNVNLNTNGIRLASDKTFVRALGELNGRDGKAVNIYLQFDGFKQRTHLEIRGKDLRAQAARAGQLRRGGADGDAGRRGRARHERGRTRGDRAVRHRASRRTVGRLPAGHPLRAARGVRPAHPAHQLRHHPPDRRATAGMVPAQRLLPGAVLLPDLPVHHLPHRRPGRTG